MKIYLFITKKKRQYAMYKAYIETLQQRLDLLGSFMMLMVGCAG